MSQKECCVSTLYRQEKEISYCTHLTEHSINNCCNRVSLTRNRHVPHYGYHTEHVLVLYDIQAVVNKTLVSKEFLL